MDPRRPREVLFVGKVNHVHDLFGASPPFTILWMPNMTAAETYAVKHNLYVDLVMYTLPLEDRSLESKRAFFEFTSCIRHIDFAVLGDHVPEEYTGFISHLIRPEWSVSERVEKIVTRHLTVA